MNLKTLSEKSSKPRNTNRLIQDFFDNLEFSMENKDLEIKTRMKLNSIYKQFGKPEEFKKMLEVIENTIDEKDDLNAFNLLHLTYCIYGDDNSNDEDVYYFVETISDLIIKNNGYKDLYKKLYDEQIKAMNKISETIEND